MLGSGSNDSSLDNAEGDVEEWGSLNSSPDGGGWVGSSENEAHRSPSSHHLDSSSTLFFYFSAGDWLGQGLRKFYTFLHTTSTHLLSFYLFCWR